MEQGLRTFVGALAGGVALILLSLFSGAASSAHTVRRDGISGGRCAAHQAVQYRLGPVGGHDSRRGRKYLAGNTADPDGQLRPIHLDRGQGARYGAVPGYRPYAAAPHRGGGAFLYRIALIMNFFLQGPALHLQQ